MTTKGPSSDTLQLRRGTATEWTTADPVLSAGEVGWERNTNKVKIGDGATAWTSLPYLAGTGVGVDHAVLSGLGDDDHPQYAALAQDESITGFWSFTDGVEENSGSGFQSRHATVAGVAFGAYVDGDPIYRWYVQQDGKIQWGPGSGAADTNLYRSAADTLKTDDSFISAGGSTTVGGGVNLDAYTPEPSLSVHGAYLVIGDEAGSAVFPNGMGIKFHDSAVHHASLRWDSSAQVFEFGRSDAVADLEMDVLAMQLAMGNGQIRLPISGVNAGLLLGGDTNLYRNAANTLKTDDGFDVLGPLRGVTIRAYGPGSQMAVFDNDFATDEAFLVGVSGDDFDRFGILAGGTIQWGSGALARDTNLYRSAANVLKTDDALHVVGTFTLDTPNMVGSLRIGAASETLAVGSVAVDPTVTAKIRATTATDSPLYVMGTSGQTADLTKWLDGSDATLVSIGATGNLTMPNAGFVYFKDSGGTARQTVHWSAGDLVQFGSTASNGLTLFGSNINFAPDGITRALMDGFGQLTLDLANSGATRGLAFGSAEDVNLYRSSANRLSTDDEIRIFGAATTTPAFSTQVTGEGDARHYVQIDGKHFWGNTASWDTNLYRSAADRLSTDDSFYAGLYLKAFHGSDQEVLIGSVVAGLPGILFGDDQDTNLYRSAANTLKTDDTLEVALDVQARDFYATGSFFYMTPGGVFVNEAAATGDLVFRDFVTGDTNNRFQIDATGTHSWGSGSGAVDTNLYRGSAGILTTDSKFHVIANEFAIDGVNPYIQAANAASNSLALISGTKFMWVDSTKDGLLFGSAQDTNLYRLAADYLKTDDNFLAGVDIYARHGDTGQVYIGGSIPTLIFGTALDTNLYRSAADTLKTDDAFRAASRIYTEDVFSSAQAANGRWLMGAFSAASGAVATNGDWALFDDIGLTPRLHMIQSTGLLEIISSAGLTIGSDTNLYRSAADVLKTDDAFRAIGNIQGSFFQTDTGLAILSEANSGGYLELDEATGHAGAAASKGRLYFIDNGSGKLQAAIRFPTGTSQIIAMEP